MLGGADREISAPLVRDSPNAYQAVFASCEEKEVVQTTLLTHQLLRP